MPGQLPFRPSARAKLFPPKDVRIYNDDLQLGTYTPADLFRAGEQKRGIRQVFERCSSFSGHIRTALRGKFPLSFGTPLPAELHRSDAFIRDTCPEAVTRFWGRQLGCLSKLVDQAAPFQKKWGAKIKPAILPEAGKLKTAALAQLCRHFGLGGQRWLCQFANGFSINGGLSQKGVFHPSHEENPQPRTPRVELCRSADVRFRERAAKSGVKNAGPLWKEALEQVEKGWLSPPSQLRSDGRPYSWKLKGFNIAFRFGVEQAGNLRACDDLKHALTNLARTVVTPIKPVSWGHLAQLSQLLSQGKFELGMLKADREAAYKQLPINPADLPCAVIVRRRPTSGLRFGFPTRTLIFGDVAAVLHYNVFSRLITTVVNRVFGIPTVFYFDDFAALVWLGLVKPALELFSRFCLLPGIGLKPGKSAAGVSVPFLGLPGSFPSPANGFKLKISHARKA